MFKFLKEKLKNAISKLDSKIKEEAKDEEIEAPSEQPAPELTSRIEEQQAPSVPKTAVHASAYEGVQEIPLSSSDDHDEQGSEEKLHEGKESDEQDVDDSEFDERKTEEQAHDKQEHDEQELSPKQEQETPEPPAKKQGFFSRIAQSLRKKESAAEQDDTAEKQGTHSIHERGVSEPAEIPDSDEEKKSAPSPAAFYTETAAVADEEPRPHEQDEPSRARDTLIESPHKHKHSHEAAREVPRETQREKGSSSHTAESSVSAREKLKIAAQIKEKDSSSPTTIPSSQRASASSAQRKPYLPAEPAHSITEQKTAPAPHTPPSEEKKGFFSRLTEKVLAKRISEKQFEELFTDLEMVLLENNVAFEVIEKIKNDLKNELVDVPIRRNKIEQAITESLRNSIESLLSTTGTPILEAINEKADKPYVICFVGINGSGKTTTIAKVAHLLQNSGITCVIAAADTFRAAAIDQLDHHAHALGVKLVKHQYGSDPAAVAFDAIKHAQAKGIDAVLIDTAGRLHSNTNLMDELRKIVRVAKPDLTIFIGESITGNDCVEQAKQFDEAIGIDQIILSKADVDEKGGAAISISYVTKKPISYIGVGQEYADLETFSKERIISQLGLEG